jgi:excisionase family DNA binding protein
MTDDAPSSAEWMTVEQAAAYLGVATVTVRRWCNTEQLNFWRTKGGVRRIWKDEAAQQAKERHAGRLRDAHGG